MGTNITPPPATVKLTNRDLTMIEWLIITGSARQVGRQIGLSDRHVRRLLRGLEERVGVTNSHALVAWAVREGVVSGRTGSPAVNRFDGSDKRVLEPRVHRAGKSDSVTSGSQVSREDPNG